jgi:hypothetical protein
MSQDSLVSCIMPTYNRRAFVPQAIKYFLRQDYERRELIIIDDGTDGVADLVPEDERIRYFRLKQKSTIGEKRNLACEQARGSLIAHWDDDDWQAPHRLSYQVESILRSGADMCGLHVMLFYELAAGRAWQYIYPPHNRPWLSGSTLCYKREFWAHNRFAPVNMGEDARFVWGGRSEQISVLPEWDFHVGIIHPHNVSPKQTEGVCWHAHSVEPIRQLLGTDWAFYHPEQSATVEEPLPEHVPGATEAIAPVRNVFACLVHENPECIVDLVRNLHYHDPDSVVLLYNGGTNPQLFGQDFPFENYGAVLHPSPRPMKWGWLHDFALDCMRFALDNLSFDTLTIVDSDQLGLRSGYSRYLARHLSQQDGIGMLCNSPGRQANNTRVAPAMQAWREFELWRPFLQRFAHGEEAFTHWSFWPSTVFTADAARALLKMFDSDEQLQDIVRRSKIWATEEILFPTLVALMDYKLAANPCSYRYVQYRTRYSIKDMDVALTQPDVFWAHPVPRRYDDGLRKHIRASFNHYERASQQGGAMTDSQTNTSAELLLTLPILARMRRIEGWLDDAEADLLIAVTVKALTTLPEAHAIVEVGSYCGRATTVLASVAQLVSPQGARVYAIDRHDGMVGSLDQGIQSKAPTLEKFKRNIAGAGLTEIVETIHKSAPDVAWDKPISLLLIDGLHDYVNVAKDFYHFEQWLAAGGYVAFHDYADYYPGVQVFVGELLRSEKYRKLQCVGSMMILQKLPLDTPSVTTA